MTRLTILMCAALTVGLVNAPHSGAQAACPAPKTCSARVVVQERWVPAHDGRVVIPYWVNPTNLMTPSEDVPRLVQAAARVWERANPRIELRYLGTTTALSEFEDGKNVIGFGIASYPTAAAQAPLRSRDGVIYEADMTVNVTMFHGWNPCEQADDSCTGGGPGNAAIGTRFAEIQGLVTHEFGHWLSLDHPAAGSGDLMTMNAVYDISEGTEQRYQTLGLGDILGVREAYPCGSCDGPPVVYAP